MKRQFHVSAYMGVGNSVHKQKTIEAFSPHDAAQLFADDFFEHVYSTRQEQPKEENGQLYSVWSSGWSKSGQRIWVREAL